MVAGAVVALVVLVFVGLCITAYAMYTAPIIEDTPEPKGVSDIRP